MNEFHHINLRELNSFGISAMADRLVEAGSTEELRDFFRQDTTSDQEWCVLGGGNNILFVGDYHGTLIRPTMAGYEITGTAGGRTSVKVGAGVEWDDFVAWSVGHGLWGAENLSLIPGKVGAAPVQNIGAYGAEAKDIIESVEMYCPQADKTMILAGGHCGFGYRDSVFKRELRGRAVITAVTFTLGTEPAPRLGYGRLASEVETLGDATLENIRRAVIAIRQSKLPDPKVTGNAGSFFKNPTVEAGQASRLKAEFPDMPTYPAPDGRIKIAAGWLIDKAGWRGYRAERAGVHPDQALVLINLGGASGGDILELAGRITADIEKKFGIGIVPEVNILPHDGSK